MRRATENDGTGPARRGVRRGATSDPNVLRLMTTVAWMYHHGGANQARIGARLGISQSHVSRLLDAAAAQGIVQTRVVVPRGLYTDVEQELIDRFGLRGAHVFDVADPDDEAAVVADLGRMFASRLPSEPLHCTTIGLTSWSRSLREAVLALTPGAISGATVVIELLGDVGAPQFQHQAAQVTERLASVTGADPSFLRVPGVVTSSDVRAATLAADPHATDVLAHHDDVDLALVGVGTCRVVPPLQGGQNFFTEEQFAHARARGAVAEINLRFIAEDGSPVRTDLDDLVVGFRLDQLRRTATSIAVAGGPTKLAAVRAVLRGHWVTTLVTDTESARSLLAD